MPPSTTRDQYITGKAGSYLVVTIEQVDQHLRTLRAKLPMARPATEARLRQDMDSLLERRNELVRNAR